MFQIILMILFGLFDAFGLWAFVLFACEAFNSNYISGGISETISVLLMVISLGFICFSEGSNQTLGTIITFFIGLVFGLVPYLMEPVHNKIAKQRKVYHAFSSFSNSKH